VDTCAFSSIFGKSGKKRQNKLLFLITTKGTKPTKNRIKDRLISELKAGKKMTKKRKKSQKTSHFLNKKRKN